MTVPAANTAEFTHHRESGHLTITLALVLVCLCEGIPVHLALHARHPAWAWTLSALTLLALVDLVREHVALARSRTRITADALALAVGSRWRLRLPLAGIMAAHTSATARERRGRDVLRAVALPGEPTVVLELQPPVSVRGRFGGTREVRWLGCSPDDRARFLSALSAAGVAVDPPGRAR
ncbi:MAG: hypothetical protein ABL977_04480 [Candidatus Eisenbacteria bacterium]